MKHSLISLLFLFALIASSAKAQPILDSKGDEVINGGQYYIHPYKLADGGGLRLTKIGNETCPLNVVTSFFPNDNGLPWTIASVLRIGFVPSNYNVDILLAEGKLPNCVPTPSKWTIVEGEDGVKSVKLTGYENTLEGSFKIHPFSRLAYVIVFCSTNGNFCGHITGLSKDGRLIVTEENNNDPMRFVFVKAGSSEVSKQGINNVLEA